MDWGGTHRISHGLTLVYFLSLVVESKDKIFLHLMSKIFIINYKR